MTDSKRSAPVLPLVAGLTGIAALSYYALRVEPFHIHRVDTDIHLSRLPAGMNGLKTLFIADMHTEAWTVREDRILEVALNCPRPDMIIWGGDYLRGRRGIPHALRLIREIQAHFKGIPAFGIFGNAEHKLNLSEQKAFANEMTTSNICMMRNENRLVTLCGETFSLIAVDDPYYGHADFSLAMQGAPSTKDHFTLLLAHSPQITTQAARAGIDLMLSGHTHGGQVRLPLIGPLKTQNPLCRRLDMGLFDRHRLTETLGYDPGGDLTVYITRGIGLANIPGIAWAAPRFLCPPEISLLTLVR